jgi:hypothetical protein
VNVLALAAGHALGEIPSKAADDLRSSLSDLLDRISGCDIDLEDRQLVEEATRRAAVEAAKDRPNRIVLIDVLRAVGEPCPSADPSCRI